MAHITIKPARKDNKFPVRISYQGAKNMFGGRDYPRTYNKLYTLERIQSIFSGYSQYPGTLVNNSGLPDTVFTQGIEIVPEED